MLFLAQSSMIPQDYICSFFLALRQHPNESLIAPKAFFDCAQRMLWQPLQYVTILTSSYSEAE